MPRTAGAKGGRPLYAQNKGALEAPVRGLAISDWNFPAGSPQSEQAGGEHGISCGITGKDGPPAVAGARHPSWHPETAFNLANHPCAFRRNYWTRLSARLPVWT